MILGLAKYSHNLDVVNVAENTSSAWSKEYGSALVFQRLWQNLRLDNILSTHLAATKYSRHISDSIFAMVLNRLTDPSSKYAMFSEWMDAFHQESFDKIQLQHLYRALDFVADNKDKIETDLFVEQTNLFNRVLDLVFFDTTSTYFEGTLCGETIAKYGYSKDHRPDRLQVVIGVMMTRDGIPVAHKVFPSNQSDAKAFIEAIRYLKKRFNVGRVVMVGDRGMMSKDGLKELEALGLEYILGVKMRKVKNAEAVLGKASSFDKIRDGLEICGVEHENCKYIVCHNPEEASRDKTVREAVVAALKEKIATASGLKALVGNSEYRKYLSIDGVKAEINVKETEAEEKYDGKYLLQTNTNLTSTEATLAYRDLWQIERGFTELKSTLELRPVFHWNEKRIRGHICICFLALVMQITMQKLLKDKDCTYSEVMNDVSKMKATHVKFADKDYLVRTDILGKAYQAFAAVGLAVPAKTVPFLAKTNET